jgi:hypothetical protein
LRFDRGQNAPKKRAQKKRAYAMHGNASAGGAMTRALDIGRSATDVGR